MKNQYRNFMVYLLTVATLTFTLGLVYNIEEPNHNVAFAATNTEKLSEDLVKENVSLVVSNLEKENPSKILDVVNEQIKKEEERKRAEQAKRQEEIEKARELYYQINVQYLNVRKENKHDSKIADVLVKGWVVKVKKIEDNGWLHLTEGGFINGKYAKSIEKNEATKLISQQESKPKPKPVFEQPKVKAKVVTKSNETVATKVSSRTVSGPVQISVVGSSNLTQGQLASILDGTGLAGIESALIAVEDTFGINALFTLAVAKLESGNGQSSLAKGKNNLFGMNAVDGNAYNAAFTYSSKNESVMDFGHRIKKNYVNKGLNTLSSINTKYSSSSAWASKVEQIMYADAAKVK